MNTTNKFLNNLFNNLSSIYPQTNGQINSNLFIIFNAYAQVLSNINNIAQDTYNDTYLNLSNVNVLEQNFGPYVDFPKPPRLNTVTNGGEIYRAILRSLYDAFLNGSTEESMDVGLSTVLSYLTIDTNTDPVVSETNNVFFNTYDTSIMLAYPATSASGTLAQPSDFSISPSGIVVTSYDPTTQTITFSGTIPVSGQSYAITYFRDHTNQINTNWINFTTASGTSPLPTDLKTIENTYRNPKFSYWWNTYNRDGNGVQIIDGTLDPSDIGLVWRLPEKYISFTDPYTNNTTKSTIALYNLSGSVYDINSDNKDINPDYLQSTKILSYVNEVSRNPNDFYIRYSQNNNLFPALAQLSGSMNQIEKVSDVSVDFGSSNFGQMDFFEKGTNFDINDLFGFGTKNVWTNVENKNGVYNLSAKNYFDRPFSLHENILFEEFFENGDISLGRIPVISGSSKLADTVGVPIGDSEDCLQLYGSDGCVYPYIDSTILSSGNKLTVDIFDYEASGTHTSVNLNLIDPTNPIASKAIAFRFGIDEVASRSSFLGANGYEVQDTIPNYHFVNTYFTNVDEVTYSLQTTSSYVLSSGNPTLSSPYHLYTTSANDVYSQLNNVQDTDRMEISLPSNKDFTISFAYATTGNPTYGYYNNVVTKFIWNHLFKNFSTTSTANIANFSPVFPGYTLTTTGGGGILYNYTGTVPSVFNIIIQKGRPVTVNGQVITNAQYFNNILGLPTSPYGFDSNSVKSIKLQLSAGGELYHYFLGNSSLADKYNSGITSSDYYYQLALNGININNVAKNILPVSNQYGWHRLSIDLGSGLNHLTAHLDELQFLDTALPYSGSVGFANNINCPSGITFNHSTRNSDEYSYFDNIKWSYYTPESVNSIYNYKEDVKQDYQGSFLDQGTVLTNRVFKGARQANFTFELIIKGLQNKFLYIIENLVNKLKPAHTMVDLNVQTDHVLNTTSLVAQYVDDPRNWEQGNLLNAVYVTDEVKTNDVLDLPGLITIKQSET